MEVEALLVSGCMFSIEESSVQLFCWKLTDLGLQTYCLQFPTPLCLDPNAARTCRPEGERKLAPSPASLKFQNATSAAAFDIRSAIYLPSFVFLYSSRPIFQAL